MTAGTGVPGILRGDVKKWTDLVQERGPKKPQ
jgi:hypothetical protein